MSLNKVYKISARGIAIFMAAIFASSISALTDIGYVGEDETEITVERNYAKPPSFPRKALRLGKEGYVIVEFDVDTCLLYTSPSPRDKRQSRMPSSA